MGKVITLDFKPAQQDTSGSQTALAQCFARHRRIGDDVFWLKENAEFLNIHQTGGATLSAAALETYESFYRDVEARLRFFPQYYRFLLSITLDLEDLGMDGQKGEALCAYAARKRLADAELSDLQRAEAERLLARRGVGAPDMALTERLQRFISHSETFSLPNKKAAYELTHIVFYLSDYGRRNPRISRAALRSLMYAGTLAFIDENADLLAEICIALRFSGADVPRAWEVWVEQVEAHYSVQPDTRAPNDDYHEYLVCNWHRMIAGQEAFSRNYEPARLRFTRPRGHLGLMRAISEYLYNLSQDKRGDWASVRASLESVLSPEAMAHLADAERVMPEFEEFFVLFSRGGAA